MQKLINLIDGIKNGWRFAAIKSYIQNNYTGIEDIQGCETDVYYHSNIERFSLTPLLSICLSSSIERFGASYCAGYGVYVKELLSGKDFMLYDEGETSNGEKVDRNIETINEDAAKELYERYNATKDYIFSVDDFLNFCKTGHNNEIIYLWTILSEEIRLNSDVVLEFAKQIYDTAVWKRSEIVEYDRISPYGGEDISYFPESNGECFIDLMNDYRDKFKTDDEDFDVLVLQLLYTINPKDKHIRGLKEEFEYSLYVSRNWQNIRSCIQAYCKNPLRNQMLEIALDNRRDCLASLKEKQQSNMDELVRLANVLSGEAGHYSLIQRIFAAKKIAKKETERKQIEEQHFNCLKAFTITSKRISNANRYVEKLETASKKENKIRIFKSSYGRKFCSRFLNWAFGEDWHEEHITSEMINEKIEEYVKIQKGNALRLLKFNKIVSFAN